MKFNLRDILPHGAIILSLMMIVFYILDQSTTLWPLSTTA